MKILYILIALTLLFISCNEDENPTQSNSGKGFLKGKVTSNNNLDILDNTFEGIYVYLIKSGSIIDSTSTDIEGNYLFEGVSEGVYKIQVKKDKYTEKVLDNIQFIGVDTLKIMDFKIYQPISGIKIITSNLSNWQKNKKNGLEFISFFDLKLYFNIQRNNLGITYSISSSPSFDSLDCFIYNKIEKYTNNKEIPNFVGCSIAAEFFKIQIKPGDKLYFKVYPIQNGVEHSRDSKELGEPIYFEAVAP